MPDTTVKYFSSTMSGAPALSGEAGKLIGVLDACLKDGFGSVTLDSLVVTDNVATGTLSTGHNFTMTGNTGPVLTIAGATPSGLNGEWRVTVTSTAAFTFATSGISNQTATGTITAKRAPAGWAKTYSGTNKAAYSRTALDATAMLLRVDDTPTQYPTLIMYEAMTDVDTGTGASTTRYFAKSSAASATARAWRLFADDKAFYLFANADGSTWPSVMMFGDIIPYRSNDAYHCMLLAHAAGNTTSHLYLCDGTTTGSELCKSYTQLGSASASGRYSYRNIAYMGVGSIGYPNLADNSIHCAPIVVYESTTVARGLMPGLYSPLHSSLPTDGNVYYDLSGENALFIQQTYSASYRAAMNLIGPWR